MRVITTAEELRAARAALTDVAFVPTMGALHEGHLRLVEIAGRGGSSVVVSIFVNPSQFESYDDFSKYEQNLAADLALLRPYEPALVFAPPASDIYRDKFSTWVENAPLSTQWEGAARPGHFRGVLTVVSILFNLVRPQRAIFGEKDFQQLRLIEQMVADLHCGISIVRAETVRDADGLALSSRNRRLSNDGRRAALRISRALRAARTLHSSGERRADVLRHTVERELAEEPTIVTDYAAVVDEQTLAEVATVNRAARILVAVTVEGTRLIDNIAL